MPAEPEHIVAEVRQLALEREKAEREVGGLERRFGRVVGAVLNGEAEKICARCWYRESRHDVNNSDPIGHAEDGKTAWDVCGSFTPLTPDAWRERNG